MCSLAHSTCMHIIIAVKIVNVGHANSKCSSPKDASSSRRLENKGIRHQYTRIVSTVIRPCTLRLGSYDLISVIGHERWSKLAIVAQTIL